MNPSDLRIGQVVTVLPGTPLPSGARRTGTVVGIQESFLGTDYRMAHVRLLLRQRGALKPYEAVLRPSLLRLSPPA